MSGKSLSKGIVSGLIGMLIATIGIDPISGVTRFSFDILYLYSGVSLIPALIGLFALSEMLVQIEKQRSAISENVKFKSKPFSWRNLIPFRKNLFKSSLIGVIIGFLPGAGGAISSFFAYNEARRSSSRPDTFGKGNMDGVVAAESANNGTTGTTLIPTLILGIPGDVVTAVMLGALILHGLQPGPLLIQNHPEFVYTIFVGFFLVYIVMFLTGKMAITWLYKVTFVPAWILFPMILILCLVGSFSNENSLDAVILTVVFGVIGYLLPKIGYPIIPMLIGIVLGPLAETSLRHSLLLSKGSLLIFFQRPVSLAFIILLCLVFVIPLVKNRFTKRTV